jgi:pimeloyl-ACP methyl ester carboxylesterase
VNRRVIVALLLVPLIAYAGLCALVYRQQRAMVYFGGFTRVAAADTDFALARPDGVVLRGWAVNPGAADAVLFFGGNAEDVSGMRESLRIWLPQRTSYLLAYRGYGASDGEPAQDALLADALALYDDVATRHPGGRIAVIGRSLGSGVAAHVAANRPVDRLVLVTPYDSLAAVAGFHYPWLPTRWLVTERFDSATALRGYAGDVLVIRGGRDTVIPPANTDRLLATFARPPRVIDLPDAGHDDVLATQAEAEALAAFLAPAR